MSAVKRRHVTGGLCSCAAFAGLGLAGCVTDGSTAGSIAPPYNEIWTADGQRLNAITFGVVDGEPLVRREQQDEKLPVFRRDMTPTEIVELVEASLTKLGNAPLVSARDLRPEKFGGADGFRFELSFVGKDNVEREATAAGTVRNGKLYLVVYEGTRLHHYKLRRDQAERIIQSVQFVDS